MAKSEWIGKVIDERYEINELLGKGGMSAVYKAYDPNLRRQVAVKLIHTHLSDNPEFVRRFEEEAAAVARLRHPHIIQVHDFDHDAGTYFIVFEYIPGDSLQERLKRLNAKNERLPLEKSIEIISSIGEALDYAHQEGLIHRDIKPANIMINKREQAILMDFGIAKMSESTHQTATGMVLGTARYMSPEQVMGERIDSRTDIYALGVLLFEMVSGRLPFEADSVASLMMKHLNEPVPDLRQLRPNVPEWLVTVINKALAKERAQRFQTAGALVNALRRVPQPPTIGTETDKSPSAVIGETLLEPVPNDLTVVEAPPGEPLPGTILQSAQSVGLPDEQITPPAPVLAKNRALMLGGAVLALIAVAIIGFFVLRPDPQPAGDAPAAETNNVFGNVSAQGGAATNDAGTDSLALQGVADSSRSESGGAASIEGSSSASGEEAASQSSPSAEFDPLFLTSYTYDGLTIGLALPAQDTERVLFSIDDPTPTIDNGRSTSGSITLANNSIGPIPLEKGDHTLYVQYVDAQGIPGEIYTFDYQVDDIVFNFTQQPFDFETEGIPAIFTLAVVDGDPNALFTYAYSVDSEDLDQSVDGVGQAGVINLEKLEPGEHTLYVQAASASEQTAVVAYPFTIE